MVEIINGKELAKKIRKDLKSEVKLLKEDGINPKLAVIMVGKDPGSQVYVRNKSKACEKAGIEFEEFLFDENTSEETLLETIKKLNKDSSIHGILLQSPIPSHLNIREAFNRIDDKKDVDGFHPVNVGKLCLNQDTFVSCTPYGIMKMFEEYKIDLDGKNAVVIRKKQYSWKTNGA